MLPMFQNKKIWFSNQLKETQDMREMLEEIKYCTYTGFGSKYDDMIDLISQMNMIEIQYPSKANDKPKEKIGIKSNRMNEKIWGKKENNEEDDGPRSSYV